MKLWRFMPPAKPLPFEIAVTSTFSPAVRIAGVDLLADRVAARVVDAQLDEAPTRVDRAAAKWPASGLVSVDARRTP